MKLFSKLKGKKKHKDDASTGSAGTLKSGTSQNSGHDDFELESVAEEGVKTGGADHGAGPLDVDKPPDGMDPQTEESQAMPPPLPPGESGEGGFMGEIIEEALFNGVLQYRVRWRDTEDDAEDWIEDYVLRSEFPGAIEEWKKQRSRSQSQQSHVRSNSKSSTAAPDLGGGAGYLRGPSSADEAILEHLLSLQRQSAMACLVDCDHMIRAQQGVLAGLQNADKVALNLVLEVLETGRPDSRWLDDEMQDIRALEIDLKREASRGPESGRVADLRDELEKVERGIDGLNRDIRAVEDALAARRAPSRRVSRQRGPSGSGASGGPLPEIPVQLNQSIEVAWDSNKVNQTPKSLQEMFSQFGFVERVFLHPDPRVTSVLIVFQNKVEASRALKADFKSVNVKRPGANAFDLFQMDER